jgi:hypothetical protein
MKVESSAAEKKVMRLRKKQRCKEKNMVHKFLGIDPQKKASLQETGRPCKFPGIDAEKKEWFAKF